MRAKFLSAVAITFTLAAGTARANELAYAATFDDLFGVIDLSTGVFTERGNMGQSLFGIGSDGGRIYGVAYGGDTLYSINTLTGALTVIGSNGGSVAYTSFGSTTSGLYAIGGRTSYLYSIDPHTGAATLLGPTGGTFNDGNRLSNGGSALYSQENLVTSLVNTVNGQATFSAVSPDLVFATAPIVVGSDLYLGGDTRPFGLGIYTVNPQDGTTTLVAATPDALNFAGFAPISTAPLPSALPLFATGLGGLGLLGWRRKRKARGVA